MLILRPKLIILVTAVTAVTSGLFALLAQSPTPAASPTTANNPIPTSSPSPAPSVTPKVLALEGNLELDDLIRVEVEHLNEWALKNDATKLVPYLNGLAIHGNHPAEIHASQNHLQFHLQSTSESRKVWINLLGAPESTRKAVAFSVGLDQQSPFDSVFDQQHPVWLTVISPAYGVLALVVVLVTLILLVCLSIKTSLLRDGGECPVHGKLRPYNLGRVQMAFWFFLIYSSYVTIWLITDALDTVTASLLALMGISAGTALSEALIDSGKQQANANDLLSLQAEKQSLEQAIPETQTQISALTSKTEPTAEDTLTRDSLNKQMQDSRQRLSQVNQQIQTLTPTTDTSVSKGFIRDVLSDG